MAIFRLSELSEKERKRYLQNIDIEVEQNRNAEELKRQELVSKYMNDKNDVLPIETKGNSDSLPIWQRYTTNNNTSKTNEQVILPPVQKNKSVFQDILGNVKETLLGASSGIKQIGNYIENANEHNSADYKGNRAKQYLTSKNVNELEKAIYKSQDEFKNNVLLKNKESEDNEDKIETNLVKKAIKDSIQEDSENIALEQEKMSNGITKKLGELAPSIGQMGVGMIANAVNPALGAGYFFTSAGGSYLDEAKQRGMTDEQAFQFGTIMGGVESATELVGLESFKKAGVGIKSLITGGSKSMGKEVAKTSIKTILKDYGIGIADNFIQEAIVDPIQEVVASQVGGKDKANWENMGQQMLQDGINGALVAMLTGGIGLGINSCTSVGEKLSNGEKVSQSEYKQAIQDAAKNGVKLEDSINDGVSQSIYKNTILSDLNTSNLSDASKNELQQYLKENKITEEQFNQISETLKQGQMSKEEQSNINRNEIKYQYEESDNEKVNKLRQDIVNNNWSNSQETKNLANMLEKIITDKDIEIRLDSNLKDNEGNMVNGSYKDGVITINPNSNRSGEFLAIHELTHAIGTDEMRNMVQKYRESNTEFNNAVEKLLGTYEASELNDEALADISGQLFSNQEFINNVANTKPSVFRKIYNEIKYLWHQFRGYKNQNQFINDLYYKWTEAYNSNNKLNDTTKYSKQESENNSDSFNLSKSRKQKQNEIIQENNPMNKELGEHTWINSAEDIKTYQEAIEEFGGIDNITPDFTAEDIKKALNTGEVTVYSSYPIEQGTFVTPSKMEAQSYAGNNQVYSKEVKLNDVAWIDEIQGQYAQIEESKITTMDNKGRKLSKEQQEYFKDSKILDRNGLLLTLYHGTNNDFNIFDKSYVSKNTKNAGFYGDGFYFTPNKESARQYGEKSKEVYLDIKNPFSFSELSKVDGEEYYSDYIQIMNLVELNPEWGNIPVKFADKNTWQDINNDVKKMLKENKTDEEIDNLMYEKYGEITERINDRLYNYAKRNNYKSLSQILEEKGYDGIINFETPENSTEIVAFYSNQIKNVDNLNPTDSPDIRYSKNNQKWREYLESHFKSTGTKTDMTKLPIDNKIIENRKQEIINKAQQIEKTNPDFQGLVDEIKNNYLGKDFDYDTYKQMNEYLDSIKPKEKDILEITTFNDSVDRRKTYMKYKNDTSDFNSNEVNLALDTIKANRNDKRTVPQWEKVAEQIGEQLAVNEKTAEEVENTAFKSWFDLQPTKNITRYDNETKSNLGFQKFTADDWVNTIYKTYNEQASKNVKQIQDNTINQTQQTIPTNKVERIYENTPGEEVNYTEMERPNGKIRKHYRSIIESSNTTAEAKKIAKELMGVDTYVKTSNKYNTEIADRNIETNGPEKALTSLTTNVNDNKKITAVDIATGERLIEYFSKIGDKDRLQEAIQTTAMAGTEAGQAVQAMSLLNHQTPQGQVVWIQRSIDKVNKDLAKRNKNGAQFDFTPEMQQKILNSTKENLQDNINEVYEELGKQVPKSHIEQLNEWRYFSMLANPKTHIRNIVGNLVMGKVQDTKNKIAGGLESVFLRNSDERNHTIKRASKEVRQFAKNDIKNVESELGLNDNKYNPKSRLQNAQRTFKSNILENTLGKAFDFNSKLLEAEDGIGLKSAYPKALAEYITANKLDINNISDKDLQKARNYAIKQAQEATFHQECQIASMLNTLENKNKVTQVMVGGLIPFKKTPMNVAITGYQYSPLGLMTSLTKGSVDLRKGKITANQYIDNISKGLTGTGIALLGYALTEAGILKASGGDDDKEKFEEQQGKQSYSIQIGDNTYSLEWLAPAGIPLFIGSELYQIGKAKEENGEVKNQNQFISSLENIANAGMTAMNPMSEMSMVSGLVSTLKSYAQDPMQGLSNTLVNMGKSYVNQMFPTALGQVSKTLDDKERSTTSTESGILTKAVDSTKNQIMSKIPGLRQMLPVATDVWGNEKEQKGNYIDNAVLPWNKKEITTNSTDKALTELYDKTGESSVLPDSYINKTLTYDKQKYRLTDQEYAELKKEYGKTSYAIVSGLTKSSEFNKMSEEQQVKVISEAYKYAKAKIKSTYASWNDIDTEDSSVYQKVQDVINNGGDAKDYFLYVGATTDVKKEKEKIQILKDSNIGSKKAIYASTIGSDDETYSMLDNTDNFNIKNYLDYKLQDFSSDKTDDGTVKGKIVSGSAKNKFYDYMDDSNFTYDQKLLLTGMKYKVTNAEREKIFTIIDDFNISKDDKLEIMSKMKGFKIYNDGRVSF